MKSKFILFQISHDDSTYGVPLPRAALYRIDQVMLQRMQGIMDMVQDGTLSEVKFNIPDANVKWLEKVTFSEDGVLCAVDEFFNPKTDELVLFDKDEYFDNGTDDDVEQDPTALDVVCTVFERESMTRSGFSLLERNGEVLIGSYGATSKYELESFLHKQERFNEILSFDECRTNQSIQRGG